MRTLLVALLLLAVPGAAAAGPALALRLGYDVSSGEATKGKSMSEVAKSDIPLQLDALWRFGPHFSAGVYYSFGFGLLSADVANRCDAERADCSVWTMRAGVEAQWTFSEVSEWLAPWIGAGIGYEWARETVSVSGQTTRQSLSGWEVLNLEGGADAKITPKLWLGPYLTVRYAEYTRLDGYGVVNKAFHRWYGFGIRGTYDF